MIDLASRLEKRPPSSFIREKAAQLAADPGGIRYTDTRSSFLVRGSHGEQYVTTIENGQAACTCKGFTSGAKVCRHMVAVLAWHPTPMRLLTPTPGR